jgi:hypothetical protein
LKLVTPKKVIVLILLHIIPILIFAGVNKYRYNIAASSSSTLGQYQKWEEKMAKKNPDYDNLSILIDINAKTLYLLQDNKIVLKKYPVATGKADTPTPIGTFKIVGKAKWGGGFGSRWMGLDVPWGKYGIHGTNKPNSIGSNASGGCIRMNNKHVEELYSYVKHNTVVIIEGGPYGPFGNGFRNLTPGDRGADVAEVQRRLSNLGYYDGSIDGVYGDGMKQALVRFLKEKKLPITDVISNQVYKALSIELVD